MSKRETAKEILARLDERVKNTNEKIDNLSKGFKDLCTHVNDELQTMNKRIKKIEDEEIKAKAERRTFKIMLGGIGSVLGVALTILGILAYLGVI